MTLTAHVEQLGENSIRAETSHPVMLRAEGESREVAVERLRDIAVARFRAAEVVKIEVPELPADQQNPWLAFAGMWKDHPDFDAYLANIAEARRELDAAESTE